MIEEYKVLRGSPCRVVDLAEIGVSKGPSELQKTSLRREISKEPERELLLTATQNRIFSTTSCTILHYTYPATMASQKSSRALRLALRQLSAPRVQQRTFVSAVKAASRPSVAQKVAAPAFVQQARGLKTVDFAGSKEDVFGRLHLGMA